MPQYRIKDASRAEVTAWQWRAPGDAPRDARWPQQCREQSDRVRLRDHGQEQTGRSGDYIIRYKSRYAIVPAADFRAAFRAVA